MAVGELIVQLMAETGSFETDTKRAGDTVAKLEKLVKQLNSTMAQGYQASENFVGPLQPSKLRPAIEGVERLNRSVQQSQAAFRGSNQIVQQASYQITDFVMQVSGGVSAMRAFSQQAPQLLGAFGAGGAALGLIAALGGAIGDLVIKSMDVKTAADAFKDLEKSTETLAGTLNLVSQVDLSGLGKNYREATDDGKMLIDANVTLNMQLIEMAKIDALATFRQGIKEAIADTNVFKLSMIDIIDRLVPAFKQAWAKPGDISGFIKSDERTFASLKDTTKEVATEVDRLNKAFGSGKMLPGEYAKGLGKLLEIPANRTKDLVAYVTEQQKYATAIARATGEQTAYGAAKAGGYLGLEKSRSGKISTSDADRLAKQELASADKFADALERQTKQLEFQQNLIGRNAQEVELLNAQYKVQAELEKTIQDMQRQGIEISQASMDKMNEAATAAIAKQQEIINSGFARRQDPMAGISDALRIYGDQANNVALGMQNVFTNAFKGMEDGIVKFAMTGKASFGDFVNAAISDLMRLYVRMAMMKLVQAGINAFAGLPDASGQQSVQGNSDYVYDLWKGGFAGYAGGGYTGEGNKYDIAGPVHKGEFVFNKEATNRIGVGTLYRMMRGYANGGYVGSNAMPTGTANGININIKNEAGGAGYEAVASAKKNENGLDVEILVRKVISGDLRNNGPMAQQMTNTFGLRRAM